MKVKYCFKKYRLILYSIILTILFFYFLIKENYHQRIHTVFNRLIYNDSKLYLENPKYIERVKLFEIYQNENRKVDIVMLGNSMTHNVDWVELLDREGIINRGISSDRTDGLLKRLDGFKNYNLKYCFIMGGINDLVNDVSEKTINENMELIILDLKKMNISPIVQSTLFVSKEYRNCKEINDKVGKLNKILKNTCEKHKISYVNLNSKLSNNNQLISKYSTDGAHLNSLGYIKWREILKPIIDTLDYN